jgi:hypothetical protein
MKDSILTPVVGRVALKATLLFVLCNLLFTFVDMHSLVKLSLYNNLVPGRTRFPFNEYAPPSFAYNLTTYYLDLLFASHRISEPKENDEYRVIILGDSSVWGYLLPPEKTLDAQLNNLNVVLDDGRRMRFYNLGYPHPSAVQDSMILQDAMKYQPDMIVWLVTLYSFLPNASTTPLLVINRGRIPPLEGEGDDVIEPTFWERTLIGRRSFLADDLRLQVLALGWGATGVDYYYPDEHLALNPVNSFDSNDIWLPNYENQAADDLLSFEAIDFGIRLSHEVPIILVNEPIFISDGMNSAIRYNSYYPRQAYITYRERLAAFLDNRSGIQFIDGWNLLAKANFTDTPLHRNAAGEQQLSQFLVPTILSIANGEY